MKRTAGNLVGLNTTHDRERGAATILIAYGLAAVTAVAALVINVGQLMVTQAELQTVADLAAKSAASELSRIYLTTGRSDPLTDTLSSAEFARVASAASSRALKNTAGSVAISIDPGDVKVGSWKDSGNTLASGMTGVTSVEVVARRDASANGVVNLLLPAMLGRATQGLRASAASRLSGISYVPAGTADFPVGIGRAWFANHASPCMVNNNKITLYPTGTADSCAGWHTFEIAPASAAAMKNILDGLRLRTWTSPAITVGQTRFEFNGGTVASAFTDLEKLYNARKNADGEMAVLIPVYDQTDCDNPQGEILIIGVARAVITKITSGSDKYIEARVECGVIENAESGGLDFGVLASGPDTVY